MNMKQFIKEQKTLIDSVIRRVDKNARIDYDERELWVMNDESLYLLAKRKGVKGI